MTKQDFIDAVVTALATMAVIMQVVLVVLAILALAALMSKRARALLVEVRETLLGAELWMAWVVALVAVAGSLFFSEVANFLPCRLCWFQRIAMYPLVVILLVGALRRDARTGVLYAFTFPIAGIVVALYHLYIEYNPEAESAACKAGASCATKWIDEFGYMTIPMLSLTAFIAIAVLLAMAWSRTRGEQPTLQPESGAEPQDAEPMPDDLGDEPLDRPDPGA